MKRVQQFVIALLLLLMIMYAGGLAFHRQIIFQAEKLDNSYEFQFEQPFEEYFIETPDGGKLNALLFTTSEISKGVILYFHGNADNLQRWGEYAVDFTSLGYDVITIDYKGYGKSSGSPSEAIFYKDAELIWHWSHEKFTYDKYVIYGRSLGSAVASYLAKKTSPDLLVLETPFNNITQDIPPILLPNSLENMFSNEDHLKDVISPIVIIHGDQDRITKLSSAKKLMPYLKSEDDFVVIKGGEHKNLREFSEYHETLKRVL